MSSKWIALCTLDEWLRRIDIQRQKCDVGHKRERMFGERESCWTDFFLKAERENPENVCYTSIPVCSGDSGVDRTTTTEAARL